MAEGNKKAEELAREIAEAEKAERQKREQQEANRRALEEGTKRKK